MMIHRKKTFIIDGIVNIFFKYIEKLVILTVMYNIIYIII